MKTFIFKTMKGGKERKVFYLENYNKPINEDEFVGAVLSWQKKKGNKNRIPSKARYQYRRLKSVYGFFPDQS